MSSASSIPVNANQIDPAVEEVCRSGVACQVGSVVSDLWILVAVGLAVGIVIASMAYLKSARQTLEVEQSRTVAERDALMEFANRVAGLSVESTTTGGLPAGGTVSAITTGHGSTGLDDVREAYRETVMSVPHYDEEYGESLKENMAIELGDEVAMSVTTGPRLTPIVKQALVVKAREAATERGNLIQALHREAESLEQAETTFGEIQSRLTKYHPAKLRHASFQTLGEQWEALDSLEQQCAETLDARQRRLQNEPLDLGRSAEAPTLIDYLYGALDVDYPVLATGASFLEQIRTSRNTIVTIATSRSASSSPR